MMRSISVFISVLFITSCHMNDTRPENHRANVSAVGDGVCVTLPDTEGESISLLSVSEIGNSENMMDKQFTIGNAPALHSNKCISNFGFIFEPGKSYVFSINAIRIKEDHTMKNGNSYSVTFSVWVDKGELKVKDIN
ncbi:putative T6SS immunity periplasmic lipoprotein [Serratia sp. NA_13]|uniref:putative T6SS immunity periplasmic lipoprotein n=1 Tax=Serratia sp. NA_13 TaxID=3415658 RepID=UPI004046DB15